MSYGVFRQRFRYDNRRRLVGSAGAASLVIQDAAHSHVVDQAAVTQEQLIILQDAPHGHAADAVYITQSHTISIADALSAHYAEAVDVQAIQYASPDTDISIGNWVNELDGTTNLYASIDEVAYDDADYVTTPLSETASILEVGLSNVTDPGVHTDHVFSFRVGGSGDLTVRLMQGATEIASWVYAVSVTENKQETLTELQAAAITDYSNLRLKFEAVA